MQQCRSTRICVVGKGPKLRIQSYFLEGLNSSERGGSQKGPSSRTRHMEVKFLWSQGALAKGQLDWKKVHTDANPADVLTKPTAREEIRRRLELVGGELHVTQSDRSLQARSEEGCR